MHLPADIVSPDLEKEIATTLSINLTTILKEKNTKADLICLLQNLHDQLQTFQARLLSARPDRSILICVYCMSKDTISGISDSFKKGNIKICIDNLVVYCLKQNNINLQRENVLVCMKINDDDIQKCEQNFPGKFKSNNRYYLNCVTVSTGDFSHKSSHSLFSGDLKTKIVFFFKFSIQIRCLRRWIDQTTQKESSTAQS